MVYLKKVLTGTQNTTLKAKPWLDIYDKGNNKTKMLLKLKFLSIKDE